MKIPDSFLEELRARTPLAPLIGRVVKLSRSGKQSKGCCPFHGEKTPSFYVYEDGYHCFGCGAHGDAIGFVMQTRGATFLEAVQTLAGEAGLEMPRPEPSMEAAGARPPRSAGRSRGGRQDLRPQAGRSGGHCRTRLPGLARHHAGKYRGIWAWAGLETAGAASRLSSRRRTSRPRNSSRRAFCVSAKTALRAASFF